MAKWNKGRGVIERMLDAHELEREPTDDETVEALVAAAARHVDSARKLTGSDPEGAYALAYDAARKAATALLAHQGLRPKSAGGHLAVVEAMEAQFPATPGLKSLDRLRRRRNESEYPNPRGYNPVTTDEALGALEIAEACLDTARRLLDAPQLGRF